MMIHPELHRQATMKTTTSLGVSGKIEGTVDGSHSQIGVDGRTRMSATHTRMTATRLHRHLQHRFIVLSQLTWIHKMVQQSTGVVPVLIGRPEHVDEE